MMIRLDSAAVNAPATHALLVSTQCHENYAWREDGSLDTENPYWKAKGGSEYLVSCRALDVDSTNIEQLIVLDRVRTQIECDNGGFQEYVIGWRIVPADFDVAGHIDPATDDYGYADFLRSSLTRMVA
jgi:hypothetical protein